jgi:hypothetical protein
VVPEEVEVNVGLSKKEANRRLDRRTDRALASASSGPDKATHDNAPLAWDVTRFVIWLQKPTIIESEEIARRALEYTGE